MFGVKFYDAKLNIWHDSLGNTMVDIYSVIYIICAILTYHPQEGGV